MKLFLWWLAVILSSVTACAAQSIPKSSQGTTTSKCGPPAYCARTDRRVEQYPEKPPAVGPAGSSVSDPTFGSRIVRITDDKTDPKQAGRPLFTPSSAEQNSWNRDSTKFYITTSGGSFLLYDFDPASMKATPARDPNPGWGPEPQFSFANNNLLYGMNRRETVFEQYDTSTGRVSKVNDPGKCIKVSAGDSGHTISVSADDNRFMTTLGPQQDKNYLIYIYDRNQGCRWFNTETGEIGGQWGPKGTVSVPDRFPLHNARMAKSGKFVYMTRGTAGSEGHRWMVWEIDTLNAGLCPKGCSGHHVMGYSHIVGSSGIVHPMDIWLRPLNHVEDFTEVITGLEPDKGPWFDSHFSWNNVDPADSAPVCFSSYQPGNPDTPGAPLLVTGPWENEIDCAETDGKASTVWRFAHTYSTARNGFWSTPRGNVSQDGRFFMFTSDWQDQLGKTPNGEKYRTDVFVVELK